MVLVHIKARPVWRGFFCDDETIRYPYKSNTVTATMLLIVIFVVVPITVSTGYTVMAIGLLTPACTKNHGGEQWLKRSVTK